jgi:5-methyltetrahydropteroyltriglutamate--homocysteine methyltransferase
MIRTHLLGFPRIGAQRELKFALERHWRGELSVEALEQEGSALRRRHWALQRDAGLDFLCVGDFAFYDQVAHHIQLFGCEPARFGFGAETPELARYFAMARGTAADAAHTHHEGCGCDADGHAMAALEMTKWFDTNYHYLVPEFGPETRFRLASRRLLNEVAEAQALGHPVKPVLLGPLSFLWLGKCKGQGAAGFDRLSLLPSLLPVYGELLTRLAAAGVQWIQLDEPILGLDLPPAWQQAFGPAYQALARADVSLLLATYFAAARAAGAGQLAAGGRLAHRCSSRRGRARHGAGYPAARARTVDRHRRRPQHLAHRSGGCAGQAAPGPGAARRPVVARALVLVAARALQPGR